MRSLFFILTRSQLNVVLCLLCLYSSIILCTKVILCLHPAMLEGISTKSKASSSTRISQRRNINQLPVINSSLVYLERTSLRED